MSRSTTNLLMVLTAISTLCFRHHPGCFVLGRSTEFHTDRLPVLAHNLHRVNINLQTLSDMAQLGPRGGFMFQSDEFHATNKGGKRTRLVQTYAKYEVFGPTVAAELDMRGYFTGQMHGHVARNLHKDIPNPEACMRDVKVLVDRVIRLENLNCENEAYLNIDKRDGRRVIFADSAKRKARIVYVVEFYYSGERYSSRPKYYIDACSNSVLFHFDQVKNATVPHHHHHHRQSTLEGILKRNNNISSNPWNLGFKSERVGAKAGSTCSPSAAGVGGNPKVGRIDYNVFPICLPVSKTGEKCVMEGTYAKVIDNKNRNRGLNKEIIEFDCDTGHSDPTNGAYGVANDALYYGEMSGSFFKTLYGITALKTKPTMYVHYKKDFANAEWDGTDMKFGDGNDEFYPFTSLDLVSHELAHGYTSSNSKLIYLFQMGGIDESFSDITSVATRKFVLDRLIWSFGGDLKKGSGAFRYMDDPPKDGNSFNHVDQYRFWKNVHYSSGVFNYAFYKLITEHGVDIVDGYEDFLVANRDLWGRFTRFRKGACAVMQASYDNGHDYNKVKQAFSPTGIDLTDCDHDALKTTLFPGETRKNIKVKMNRSPIFEVDMRTWRGDAVRVKAEDSTVVGVAVATDGLIGNIIAKGNNYVKFPGNHTRLYVRLVSDKKADVKVSLQVLQKKIEK